MAPEEKDLLHVTRRALLKSLGAAPLLLSPSPLPGFGLLFGSEPSTHPEFPLADFRLTPHYPERSPLQDLLRLVAPGSDEYATEKYAFELAAVLRQWSAALRAGTPEKIASSFDASLRAASFVPSREQRVRSGGGLDVVRREFSQEAAADGGHILPRLAAWVGGHVETAEFEITSIEEISPEAVRIEVRYDLVTGERGGMREEKVGTWHMEWARAAGAEWRVRLWQAAPETVSRGKGPIFVDVTERVFAGVSSYRDQLLLGADHWRTVLDGACGIDVYGNNGVAAGDYDNDGWDDLYVSQPAGLPNRLYRNRGDGTFEDVTEKAGVGVLDNTACALFADFRNSGLQDLLVVCGSAPLLFLNQGDGTFRIKRDAFQFARAPEGTFTHAALADYDRDGRLDVYFCVYSYYLGLDQYHYPIPYYDARNGPPNFLMRNQGDGTFVDATEAAGLNVDNDRYSFAAAWGESLDLYVANDFGRNTFYRNRGGGTFESASTKAHVEDVGAGMSACWADAENDGRQDIYVANMWSAAGQRVSEQARFHANASPNIRDLYKRHARGNAFYRNQGNGVFTNATEQAGVEVGRWAWCSDFFDFDHDGYQDLYVTNGYISAPGEQEVDLGSFFWRQVVARSPEDATPSPAYERGWSALNELIRSDRSWSGFERNVLFANNRDGTFSEVSGVAGMDFLEDSRSFALADLDHDGRLEVVLKNRNAPQLRVLHNEMAELGDSIAFRLRGTKSNRDAIGAAITVESGTLRQTRSLQAGTGFLAQHTRELFFGLGKPGGNSTTVKATIRWPSGLTQQFEALPRNHRILLVEGDPASRSEPFAPAAHAISLAATPVAPISRQTETWLLDPLKAPEFSLPDTSGTVHTLAQQRGHPTLLCFWANAAPSSQEQLRRFQEKAAALRSAEVSLLAIRLDDLTRPAATPASYDFPVLLATEEIAGIYNIVYRYLFDRRRDLPLPSAFLIDAQGDIVKLYQGTIDIAVLLADLRRIPATAEARVKLALPFPGTLYDGSFQRNDFTYGVAMFQHGYLEQAAASFEQVVAAKPNDAEGYYNLGTLSLRRKDLGRARRYLEQTVKLRPNYPEAWNNLGMIAAQQGQADEAIQNFQKSLSQRPTYAIASLNLGNVYRRQGDLVKAEACLRRALELEPGDPETNYSLGMFYAQQNQLASAGQYLQKAVELRPGYPEALNNLGVLFVRQQEYASAEEQFRTCIRYDPRFAQSYLNLARLYVLQHDKEKARAALDELLRIEPESAAARQGIDMLKAMP